MKNWSNLHWKKSNIMQDDIVKQYLIYGTDTDYGHKDEEILAGVMLLKDDSILVSYFHNDARTSQKIQEVIADAKAYIEPIRVIGIERFEITDKDKLNTTFHMKLNANIALQDYMKRISGEDVKRDDFGCIVDYNSTNKGYYLVPFSSDQEDLTVFYNTLHGEKIWLAANLSAAMKQSLLENCKKVINNLEMAKAEAHRYYFRKKSTAKTEDYLTVTNNKLLAIQDFDGCIFQKDVGEWAYGYVEYQSPLDEELVKQYHLSYREPSIIGNDGQAYRIRFGHFGNGLTVMNQYEVFSDEPSKNNGNIAHISDSGEVTLYRTNLPEEILQKINAEAERIQKRYHTIENHSAIHSKLSFAEDRKSSRQEKNKHLEQPVR